MSAWADGVIQKLVQQAGQDEFDHRIAVALGECVLAYCENTPDQSASGRAYGLGRRRGRQDLAVAVVATLLGRSKPEAEELIHTFANEKGLTLP